MQMHLALVLLVAASTASAAEMVAIPEGAGFCARMDGICYEWQLTSDPAIRLVAHGYEDGVEYSFYKKVRRSHRHLVRIHPALRDEAHSSTLFWGYPWDIQDLAVVPGAKGKAVFASFDHSIVDDGEVYSPAWQKRIPVVLFVGRTTQPNMKVPLLHFQPMRLSTLRTRAED